MSLKSVAEKYFSTLNPMAARMCTDMEEIKLSYESLWPTLSNDEQQQILNETIIKPEVSVKYTPKEDNNIREYAMKLVIDDHCSYRDEHSGPFSFRTQSQRDLSMFEKEKPPKKSERKASVKESQSKPKYVVIEKAPLVYAQENDDDYDSDSSNSLLPKTGLDFLDNW